MKKIKVELTPREWAEKRFKIVIANLTNPEIHIPEDAIDEFISVCGFVLKEEADEQPEIPTDKVEAVKYFLNQLPDGYRERALAQVDEERVNSRSIVKDVVTSIDCFNIWDRTKEGSKFWERVFDHYSNPTKYPTLPPLPKEKLDDPSTKLWTGYFTDKGERVYVGDTHEVFGVIATVQRTNGVYSVVFPDGTEIQLNDVFKYHKP